ncbi:hypothetical protein BOTBODRAFT_177417 [Botryobasidium botryosum FD-172 SS1]|uniref:Uncharacterized protein n=1 Tax=Botryobasidium botryosum (strain FD-172 SS1) TaxID=930990 RepID=A0A067MHN9_BOTB1|nr:hypothetical protein BOTBODRAFT_177417 [Botryobasidium botryosum FD-172 SS1]
MSTLSALKKVKKSVAWAESLDTVTHFEREEWEWEQRSFWPVRGCYDIARVLGSRDSELDTEPDKPIVTLKPPVSREDIGESQEPIFGHYSTRSARFGGSYDPMYHFSPMCHGALFKNVSLLAPIQEETLESPARCDECGRTFTSAATEAACEPNFFSDSEPAEQGSALDRLLARWQLQSSRPNQDDAAIIQESHEPHFVAGAEVTSDVRAEVECHEDADTITATAIHRSEPGSSARRDECSRTFSSAATEDPYEPAFFSDSEPVVVNPRSRRPHFARKANVGLGAMSDVCAPAQPREVADEVIATATHITCETSLTKLDVREIMPVTSYELPPAQNFERAAAPAPCDLFSVRYSGFTASMYVKDISSDSRPASLWLDIPSIVAFLMLFIHLLFGIISTATPALFGRLHSRPSDSLEDCVFPYVNKLVLSFRPVFRHPSHHCIAADWSPV